MDNTKQNIQHFRTSLDPEVSAKPAHQSNQGSYVFFRVNVKELFGIDLNYPGIRTALNKAFMAAKPYTPVDTGITRRSMTMKEINPYEVEVFYDPKKIIGQVRKGVVIKENYTIYIAESPKRWNWLSIVMKHFYDTLFREVKKLKSKYEHKEQPKNKTLGGSGISFIGYGAFMEVFNSEYKAKKEEAKLLREEQRKKRILKEEAIKEKKRLRRLKNESIKEMDEEA